MLTSMFNSSTLPMLEQVVNFTEARHGVLAGNIANLDTPGYKTRDLSPQMFQQRLQDAIERGRQSTPTGRAPYPNGAASAASTSSSTSAKTRHSELAAVTGSMQGILRHDENNSSLEHQVSEISKNYAQHNLALSLMTAQFRLLRAAITERV